MYKSNINWCSQCPMQEMHIHTHIYVIKCVGSKKPEELRYHCEKVSEKQNTSAQSLVINFNKDGGYHSNSH